MTIQDNQLKQRALRAIALQDQKHFILDLYGQLPLANHPELAAVRYSLQRDESGGYFDYETDWGLFSLDPETRSILTLHRGKPPAELLPQARLALATATAHTGYVSIHNNGSSFDLDFQGGDRVDGETLRSLNQILKEEQIPVVVWQLDEVDETPKVIRIANESAMLFASSAIWDNDEQQLVATQVVTTSQELLKAIKATLANNGGKNYFTLKSPDGDAYLKGARRGYVAVSSSLANANAEGSVTSLLHPLSGDPQANSADHFYVVVTPVEALSQKFRERLDLAIPWPIQPAWADYLLEAGQDEGLVQVLPSSGDDFAAGLRIVKNEARWRQVIADGLQNGRLQIE